MFNRQALCMFRMLDDGHRLFPNDVLWKRGPKLSVNNCLCNSLGVLICVSGFWLSLRYWETWLYWVSVVCGRWCWGSLRCTYGLLNRFLMLTHCAGTCWYFPALNLTTQTSQQQRRLHMTIYEIEICSQVLQPTKFSAFWCHNCRFLPTHVRFDEHPG